RGGAWELFRVELRPGRSGPGRASGGHGVARRPAAPVRLRPLLSVGALLVPGQGPSRQGRPAPPGKNRGAHRRPGVPGVLSDPAAVEVALPSLLRLAPGQGRGPVRASQLRGALGPPASRGGGGAAAPGPLVRPVARGARPRRPSAARVREGPVNGTLA